MQGNFDTINEKITVNNKSHLILYKVISNYDLFISYNFRREFRNDKYSYHLIM